MTDRDDRANFGRSSQQFNALTLDLPVASGAATPDAQRVAQVVAAVPPATVTIALEDGVIARLPADADLSVPRANGADLEFVQPDGTVIVITGGAISGLVLFVGDVEIPADAVATIFASNGIVPAAGPETSGDTSGSGSFVDLSQQSVGDGLQGIGLLDNTDGPNAAVIGGDIGGDANVAPVILAHDGGRLSEEGLAEGVADADGNTDTTDDATLSGRIVVSDVGPLTFIFLQPTGLYTSGGTPITWVAAGGTLVGSAGTETVFEAVIDATGTWTVSLKGPFDHPLGLGENELPVQLNVLVSDTGGLSTPTTLTIILEDDMPALEGKIGEVVIDESDLLNGEAAPRLTGALPIALGSDGGTITLSAEGATWSEARQELLSDDGLWRIDLNDDGSYTFLLFQNSTAHSAEIPNDVLDIRVTYTATDADGDILTGNFTLGIRDDAPSFGENIARGWVDEDRISKSGNVASEHMGGNYDGDAIGEDEEGIEDDSIPSTTFTGDLAIRWGADNENSNVAGTPDRDVTFTGVTNGQVATYDVDGVPAQLTSNGQLVHLWVSADGHTLVGYTGSDCSIGSKQVFTVSLSDAGTGSYTFTLLQNLDHPIANTEDDIRLGLNVRATDSDGDHTDGTIWVRVDDDAPTFTAEPKAGQIDEEWISLSGNTGLEHTYPGDGPGFGFAKGSLNISWGMDRRDGFGDIDRSVAFTGRVNDLLYSSNAALLVYATNAETTLPLTHDGESVRIWLSADGATLLGYVGNPPEAGPPAFDQQVFVVVLSDSGLDGSGGYVFTLLKSLDHPVSGIEDDLRLEFEVRATDADGDSVTSTVSITVNDDAPRVSSPASATLTENTQRGEVGETFQVQSTGARSLGIAWGIDDANSGVSGHDRSVRFADDIATDMPVRTDGPGEATPALTSNGSAIYFFRVSATEVWGLADDDNNGHVTLGDRAVFRITLSDSGSGSYVFELRDNVDHMSGNGQNSSIALNLGFVATDSDGDSVASQFSVRINDDNDRPSIGERLFVTVDEDGLSGGNVLPAGTNGDVFGALTSASGSLAISWGADDGNSGATDRSVAFSGVINGSNAQSTDGALTSGGVQVKLWAVGNTVYGYTGSNPGDGNTAPAADRQVFTVRLSDADAGSYTFTLLKPLDHALGNGENDLQLRFDFVATDGDGDTATSFFKVTIDDDAPTAVKDDAVSFNEDSGLHSGNVMTNDLQGADGATLTKVTFDGGQSWKVIADGVSDGNGAYSFTLTGVGTYTFAASGAWTFTAAKDFAGQTSFAYIITDADGDESDPEVIIENPQTITVNPVNDAPVIAGVNNATIAENATGVLIDSFTVSDIDTATGLTFRVLRSGNVDSRFEIVAADGTTQGTPGTYELRLKAGESFDYEAEVADSDPSINLTIEVNDNSGANTLATRPIRILVTDVFENVAPVIGASTTLKTVTEDFSFTVPQGERVTNGSFEGPNSAARLSGWTVNNLLQLGEPHSGSNALSPYMGTGSLSQTISTVPGATYRIQFWASNPFDTFGEVESLTVNWGGQSVLALGNVPGSGAYRNYTLYGIDVTAQSSQTVLSIALQDTKGYWLIDDVSVAVVPGVETVSGTIAFTDGNETDSHVVSFTPAASGYLGTFTPVITNAATGDGAGVVTWTYSVNDADIQHLALGQTVTQSYTVYIQDSNGAVSSQQVSVQLGGTNDLPVARLDDGGSNAAFQMTEDTASKTFNVLANDTLDVDSGSPNSVTLGTITVPTNSYGIDASDLSVSVTADNQIKVDLIGSDWNKLAAGAFMTLGINYTLRGDQSGDQSAAMLQVKITGANDAPVLDATLTPTFSGQQNSGAPVAGVTTGTLVSTLANLTGGGGLDNVSDVDGYIAGMAITGVNSSQGTWYWSANGGTSWIAVGAVSSTNALLLRSEYLLYFAPSADFTGTILNGLTFQAWDHSAGTPGTYVNATINGGATALSSTSDTVAVVISDTTPPTVTSIAMSDTALKIGDTSTVTITFSEAVSNFDNTDVTVQNGLLSPLSTADGGRTWTGTFTPSSNISDTSNVISVAATYTDVNGNAGTTGSSGNYVVDTTAPTVTVTMSDSALKIGETATVTFTFSEAVTSFDVNDVTVQNGLLGTLSTVDGGITWTGTFTPSSNISDTSNVISVATSYTDAAGNTGASGSSPNYTIDTAAPTVTVTMSDTALTVGESATVTITFSEAVSSFDNSDVTVQNGVLGQLTTANGGITWTGTFTPSANISDTTNVITVATSYTDAAGNAGSAGSSANYSIDTVVQTNAAPVAVNDTILLSGAAPTGSGWVYHAANGHYYKLVSGNVSWSDAVAGAAAQAPGAYLLTLTSAAEQTFVLSNFSYSQTGQMFWLGGSDSAVEGTFKWVTGPEAGSTISGYTPWNSGEPNNWGGNEDYIALNRAAGAGYNTPLWNDAGATISSNDNKGYIVEWGGLTFNPSEDSAFSISTSLLLANDTDANSDTLTVTSVQNALHGTVSLNGTTITFTPDANYNGPASFSYTISDGKGGTSTAVANFTIDAVSDAPTGTTATITLSEDVTRVLTLADFGYSDADGDAMSGVTITSLTANSSVGKLLYGNVAVTVGQFISAADIAAGMLNVAPVDNAYNPNLGDITFGFKVQDSTGASDASADTITIRFDNSNKPDATDSSNGASTVDVQENTGLSMSYKDLGGTDNLRIANLSFATLTSLTFLRSDNNLEINWASTNSNGYATVIDQYVSGNAFENFLFQNNARYGGMTISGIYTLAQSLDNTGLTGQRIIAGTEASDSIIGGTQTDIVFGNGGHDTLYGNAGNDLLIGGLGTDRLEGGADDDTYMFGLADGNDTIFDSIGTSDKIFIATNGTELKSLYAYDTNTASSSGSLMILFNGQSINVEAQYNNTGNALNTINFDNGTVYGYTLGTTDYSLNLSDPATDSNYFRTVSVSSGSNFIAGELDAANNISGGSGADLIFGGDRNDTLAGGGGNNLIVGGKGNDTLSSGGGNDVFAFGLADGTDTITDTGGTQDSIFIDTNGAALTSLRAYDDNPGTNTGNLVIQYNGQQVTVNNHFTSSSATIERISFDGGSVDGYELGTTVYAVRTEDPNNGGGSRRIDLSSSGFENFVAGESGSANTITGGSVKDLIFGGDQVDVLSGGGGDDYLSGGAGADTLTGGIGNDTLRGGTGADVFKFAESGTANKDTIADFVLGDGDRVDLSSLLDNAYGSGNAVSDFVRVTGSGTTLTVQVDTDGAGNGQGWTDVVDVSTLNTSGHDSVRVFFEGVEVIITD